MFAFTFFLEINYTAMHCNHHMLLLIALYTKILVAKIELTFFVDQKNFDDPKKLICGSAKRMLLSKNPFEFHALVQKWHF